MFSSLSYFWGETFRSLFRNRFMAIASVLTVTLSMFILGVFLSAVLNINHMASYLENQVEMTVYLKDGLTTDQVMGIGKYLKAQPGMKEIKFTNKDQAMKDFRERMGDQQGLLDAINGNPLPASYQMSFQTPEQLKTAAEVVAKYQGVETVQYGKDIIEQLYKVAQVIRLSGIVLIIFLAGAELFIISNTIRLTVFARRREIQIMKYVGATNAMVTLPFFMEGLTMGLISGAITSAAGIGGYYYIVEASSTFGGLWEMLMGAALVPVENVWPTILTYSLAGGALVGALGSTFSIRKHLNV